MRPEISNVKGTLRASMAQGVNLTPQLLQSIRLLQLTSQQLEQELAQTLDRNPLLETEDAESEVESIEDADAAQLEAASWDELPEAAFMSGLSGNSAGGSDLEDASARIAEGESTDMRLRLLDLLALHWNKTDLTMAAWWLDRCDDNGYLEQSLDALMIEGAAAFDADALHVVRQRLLHGEWAGMAAADPAECLRAQLRVAPEGPANALAAHILADHLTLLAAHDDAALAAATGASLEQVKAAVALVMSLRAYPAQAPASAESSHILPDVVVWFAGGAWRVALGRHTTPRVRISAHCERALAGNGGDNAVLRGLLDEARWLVRGLAMRNDTLMRTAQLLVERQRGFLERGEEAILPLTLREVAEAIGVHESTVSRIVSGKYIQTPRGTIELKRLFAVRLEGADVSGSAVRAMVKRLIDDEPRTAPLADDVIAGLLARQGVRIARRTVAKYRDQLSIGPAKARQSRQLSHQVAA
ncbi:MAG: RNA polymerase factor sigma-54 [Pseudoxanthomonas sp.]